VAVSIRVWEPLKPDAAGVATPCLHRSIRRRTSDALPYGPGNGCTGAPGHLVVGRCTVDGSRESHLVGRGGDVVAADAPLIVTLFPAGIIPAPRRTSKFDLDDRFGP